MHINGYSVYHWNTFGQIRYVHAHGIGTNNRKNIIWSRYNNINGNNYCKRGGQQYIVHTNINRKTDKPE